MLHTIAQILSNIFIFLFLNKEKIELLLIF